MATVVPAPVPPRAPAFVMRTVPALIAKVFENVLAEASTSVPLPLLVTVPLPPKPAPSIVVVPAEGEKTTAPGATLEPIVIVWSEEPLKVTLSPSVKLITLLPSFHCVDAQLPVPPTQVKSAASVPIVIE